MYKVRKQRRTKMFLVMVLLTFAYLDCAYGSITAGPKKQFQIKVLAYNTHGLPSILAADKPRIRFPIIASLVTRYDLALLQEDFAHHDLLVQNLTKKSGVFRGENPKIARCFVCAPSGLTLITQTLDKDWKIKKSSFHAFEECSGWLSRLNDCFAQKGFQEIAFVSTSGHELLLINTHLDAGRSQWDREARKKQLEQLAFSIEKAVRKEAIIVGGDFNLDWDDNEDKKLLYSFLDRLKLTLAVRGGASNKRWRTLDYIFFRSGLNAQLRVADSGEDFSFSPDSQPLSDHPAIYANFSVR